ncbi:MAG TPA: BTAD domain-containing putative transcriptional regulator [Pseudonocardiaceae bacterium]|jgi:DNA-binding SARP family transcriptional activator/DNA-binding CsgD family transcriptional regulator
MTITDRERTVLRNVGRGHSDGEIAASLHVSEDTVRRHVGRILDKLGLRDRAAAIVYAFDNGVVEPCRTVGRAPIPVGPRAATPARLRFAALGPLRAWSDGHPVDLGPVRQQAVLSALLLRPDVTVARPDLLSDVWDFEQPSSAVAPVYIYRLRQRLTPRDGERDAVIASDSAGYRFVSRGIRCDVAEWDELVDRATQAERDEDLRGAVDAYSRALALFTGEPLAGLPGPFAAGQRLRLAERRMAVTLAKLRLQVRLGDHADAIGELFPLTQSHPYHESAAALLIHTLNASGRQADALAVYRRTRQRLINDLGVEPGPALCRAHWSVLRG